MLAERIVAFVYILLQSVDRWITFLPLVENTGRGKACTRYVGRYMMTLITVHNNMIKSEKWNKDGLVSDNNIDRVVLARASGNGMEHEWRCSGGANGEEDNNIIISLLNKFHQRPVVFIMHEFALTVLYITYIKLPNIHYIVIHCLV